MVGEEMQTQICGAGVKGLSLHRVRLLRLSREVMETEITSVLVPGRQNLSHHQRSISPLAFEAS